MIQQEINLNLIPSSEPVVVHCNQYDEGKSRIIAHLYNGSHPYTPGANATVKVQGTKPDNHAFQYWCDLSGSTVTIDINIQMTAVAGRTPTQLIVTEYTGITGSFAFILDIQPSTLQPLIDVSETDLPIYTEEAQEAAQRAVQAASAAEQSAADAAAWSSNPPYIGLNKNWYVYDITTEQFVDSGICAEGIGIDNIAKTATVGLIDTYTITYTDGNIQDYYVTNGADGNKWYKGTAISGGSSTPTVFPSSGITKANHNDFFLNTTEGAIYHCETGGDASTATWAYDFTLTGGGSGGVTNYNDLSNRPQINGVILSGNKSTSDLGINSGNVMLSSIMHIGGQTQTTTQEALEALDNKDSGGSFIKVTTPDASLYGDTLTLSDGTTTLTTVFDSSGNAEFNGVMMTGTLTLTTGSITRQIEVPYFGNYSQVISLWSATIAITTDSVDLYGETVTIKDSLNQTVGTATISAQGTASVQVSATGTYTVYCSTLSPEAVVVSAQTTYFVTFHLWTATLSISTTSTALYGKSITIKKGSTTIGTTAFSSSGSATYRVHETGIYTLTCDGYDASVTVLAETTYPVSILAGLDLASWISAGSTTEHPLNPSSYADFAALEADEEAIRQLMTVHASVDYLAQATAGDSLMQSVINSDVCAKWINLSDYALNTLYANSDIADVMDTADKYGYGEWGIVDSTTTPPTWGALGNVPIMTANNAPYGVASAYQVFDGNASTSASGTDFSYQSVNLICVKKFECSINGGTLQGSNDGSTYTDISDPSSNTTYYMYHRVHFASSQTVHTLQFYGRELTPLVPTMTANDKPKGQASASSLFSATYPAFQAFDGDDSKMWASSEDTNDQWVEYDFVNTVKPCQYYIKPIITISGSTAYSKTAQVAVQGYINNEWVNISEKTLVSNSTTTAGNTTPSEIRGNITNPAEINKIRANFGEKVGVQRDGIYIFQAYGMDYSEKEFAPSSTRKTIYDHGVAPSGAITGGTKNPDCLTLSAVGTATVTIDKGTRTYMGGKAGLHASGTNRLICGSGYSAFTASNMPDSNGLDISSISGSVAVGIEQTASGTFDCTEIWIE